MRVLSALLLAPILAACASAVPVAYTGQLTRTSGTCTTGAATLTLRGTAASFAPDDGALILTGTATPDGAVTAALETPGINGKPYRLLLTGTLTHNRFTGRYATPTCRATVSLQP